MKININKSNQLFLILPNTGKNIPTSVEESGVFKQKNKNLVLTLSVDTEYTTSKLYNSKQPDLPFNSRFGVTSQFRNNLNGEERIFVHTEFAELLKSRGLAAKIRHPIAKSNFHVVDYLQNLGFNVELVKRSSLFSDKDDQTRYKLLKKTPTLTIELWAYFALVDITMICQESCSNDLNRAFIKKDLTMKRRLNAEGKNKNGLWITPWAVYINGVAYKVNIKIHDACAAIGNASYKQFCKNVGIELTHKDLPDNYIKRMDVFYLENPEKYDAYALGDLKVCEAFREFEKLTKQVYKDVDLEDYKQEPKMTIGATVANIIESVILKNSNMSASDWLKLPKKSDLKNLAETQGSRELYFEKLTSKASADYLSKQTTNQVHLLSKCDGGRCWNAKPTTSNQKGILVDIDISGAYSNAMSSLKYPLGKPLLISSEKGVSLTKFLNYFGKELVPRLWYARIETNSLLDFPQDLIPSWFGFTLNRKQDSENYKNTGEVDLDSGTTKILTKQIINGTLTSDLLDCIQNEWSPRQRDDFFKKVVVLSAGFYPESLEVDKIALFHEATNKHNRKADFITNIADAEIINKNDCHTWFAFDLGEELINPIRNNRKKHIKDTPLNALFKLINNTVYGDSVSKYFITANMIVGANITAMVRTVMWYAEKALNLQGSITDGHIFDVNKVLLPTKSGHLNKDKLAVLYHYNDKQLKEKKICKFGGLFDEIVGQQDGNLVIDGKVYSIEQAKEVIAAKAMMHIKKIFKNNTLLNGEQSVFTFEVKKIINRAAYHGSANYFTEDIDGQREVKMRSYESKTNVDGTLKTDHSAFRLEKGQINTDEKYYRTQSPAYKIMNDILNFENQVKLQPQFIKSGIIKPGQYANNHESTFKDSHLAPGDNMMKIGKPPYFALAQFHFETLKQYKGWEKANKSLSNKWGLSFELFFLNEDGTLNYQKMITTVDKMIREGVINPLKLLDPHHNLHRKIPNNVKENIEAYERMRAIIEQKTNIKDDYLLEEVDFDENEVGY